MAAAGAAAGVVLAAGHGVAPAAAGGGIGAVTMLAATFWWERAREPGARDSGGSAAGPVIRIRQRIRKLGHGSRVIGARSSAHEADVDVGQALGTVGPDTTVIGYDGDPGKTT